VLLPVSDTVSIVAVWYQTHAARGATTVAAAGGATAVGTRAGGHVEDRRRSGSVDDDNSLVCV